MLCKPRAPNSRPGRRPDKAAKQIRPRNRAKPRSPGKPLHLRKQRRDKLRSRVKRNQGKWASPARRNPGKHNQDRHSQDKPSPASRNPDKRQLNLERNPEKRSLELSPDKLPDSREQRSQGKPHWRRPVPHNRAALALHRRMKVRRPRQSRRLRSKIKPNTTPTYPPFSRRTRSRRSRCWKGSSIRIRTAW
jgi:hypothetical protein